MYDKNTFFQKLNGQFSFVLYDSLLKKIFVSRDHVGITPMYYSYTKNEIAFSSELKTLTEESNIKSFYPRNYIYDYINVNHYQIYSYLSYFNCTNKLKDSIEISEIKHNIVNKLIESVKLQLRGLDEDSFGVLLSGGLDSSLIASIICKYQSNHCV
jgi:asparagine synthase (glutamine-hydrolysing)